MELHDKSSSSMELKYTRNFASFYGGSFILGKSKGIRNANNVL